MFIFPLGRTKLETRETVVAELARIFAGEEGETLTKYLLKEGESTDEKISSDIDMSIGVVRKILYALQDRGLISCRIERNPDTGWITYWWFVPIDQVDGVIYNIKRRVLARLEKRLEYETENVFYWCGNETCPKINFSDAVDNLFTCPRCGRRLKPYDNSETIAALKFVISRLKSEVEKVFQ